MNKQRANDLKDNIIKLAQRMHMTYDGMVDHVKKSRDARAHSTQAEALFYGAMAMHCFYEIEDVVSLIDELHTSLQNKHEEHKSDFFSIRDACDVNNFVAAAKEIVVDSKQLRETLRPVMP